MLLIKFKKMCSVIAWYITAAGFMYLLCSIISNDFSEDTKAILSGINGLCIAYFSNWLSTHSKNINIQNKIVSSKI